MMLGVFILLAGCMAGGRQLNLSRDEPSSGGPTGGEPTGQPAVLPPTTTFATAQSMGRSVSSGNFSGYVSMGAMSDPRAGSSSYEMVGIPVATGASLGLQLSVSEGAR